MAPHRGIPNRAATIRDRRERCGSGSPYVDRRRTAEGESHRFMNTGPIRVALFQLSPTFHQAPIYRRLAQTAGIDFQVIYASRAGITPFDNGYGQPVSWDVDLLSGYRHRF